MRVCDRLLGDNTSRMAAFVKFGVLRFSRDAAFYKQNFRYFVQLPSLRARNCVEVQNILTQ